MQVRNMHTALDMHKLMSTEQHSTAHHSTLQHLAGISVQRKVFKNKSTFYTGKTYVPVAAEVQISSTGQRYKDRWRDYSKVRQFH